MKQAQIQELSISELKDRIAEETQLLAKLVFNHTVSAIENPLKIRDVRRGVARLKTDLKKRELAQNSSNN
jgi:large subunit ribosomal protein L29